MSWIELLFNNLSTVLICIIIVLWALAAAIASVDRSCLISVHVFWVSYWVAQVPLFIGVSKSALGGPAPVELFLDAGNLVWGFLVGDVVFVSWIVWDKLVSPEALKRRREDKSRQSAIAAIAARGGFTDPRRNSKSD